MVDGLIAAVGLLSLLGFGNRLVERPLQGVGVVSIPARLETLGNGEARDDDLSRLDFRFSHEYVWASFGKTVYRQLLTVSVFAPDAAAADYEERPPRFELSYSKLTREPAVELGAARILVSAGRYVDNTIDEPAHLYMYVNPSRRLQILWHAVDKDLSPKRALEILPRMAASFEMRTDPIAKLAEMRGFRAREQQRAADAVSLARATLSQAGLGAAAPGKPVVKDGVYVEWMTDPEPRFQLVKPLGLLRLSGNPPFPTLKAADGARRNLIGSIGWRAQEEGLWVSTNRDNGYLPLPGIDDLFATMHSDESTALYYFATTIRIEHAEVELIPALGRFYEELPEVERAWRAGTLVSGERLALPKEVSTEVKMKPEKQERSCFGIDLETGTPPLDSLRRRLADAARRVLPEVREGRFDAADSQVLAVDRDIQAAVMLGAMYTDALRAAVAGGERETRPEYITALHERALHWRLSAYPEPHTAYEADDYQAGRDADREQLAALLASGR